MVYGYLFIFDPRRWQEAYDCDENGFPFETIVDGLAGTDKQHLNVMSIFFQRKFLLEKGTQCKINGHVCRKCDKSRREAAIFFLPGC